MHMEALQCNYTGVPDMLRSGVPMSPPDTPPGDKYLESHGGQCDPSLFSETRYTTPQHLSTIYDDSPYDDSNNNKSNNPDDLSNNSCYDSSIDGLAGLRIREEDIGETRDDSSSNQEYYRNNSKDSTSSMASTTSSCGGANPRRKKSSKSSVSSKSSSSSESSSSESRSRKDSFVYDVRLTNEQFLFWVPDMDLVKSHLMFAVREEVEVLKERIVELMDRINVLEVENSVLRQYASPEAILQVQQQQQQQQQQQSQHPTT